MSGMACLATFPALLIWCKLRCSPGKMYCVFFQLKNRRTCWLSISLLTLFGKRLLTIVTRVGSQSMSSGLLTSRLAWRLPVFRRRILHKHLRRLPRVSPLVGAQHAMTGRRLLTHWHGPRALQRWILPFLRDSLWMTLLRQWKPLRKSPGLALILWLKRVAPLVMSS